MNKKIYQLEGISRGTGAVILTILLAIAILLAGVGKPLHQKSSNARELPVGLEPVSPHPDLIKRLEQEGYSSATIVGMFSRPEGLGIDQPEEITTAVIGTKKALVLLIDFPDKVKNGVSTTSFYNNLLFSDGTYPAPGSMRDFYQLNSYGQFDVIGTVGSWVRAAHNSDYYAKNDGVHNKGYGPYPTNAAGLVREAVLLANPVINYADFDEGGVVKNIFVIHAGQGAEVNYPSDLIWSHKWSITDAGGPATTVDGVTVNAYTIQPEFIYTAGDSTIGVFAHEYGHALGLPDLYDTSPTQNGSDLASWSLMAGGSWNGNNGDSPASFDAWSKVRLGWITPTVLKSDVTNKVIPPVYNNEVVYKLWKNGLPGKEYFLVENRQKTGFDAALPGSGLLIYHVDDNKFNVYPEQGQRCINHSNWLCGAAHGLISLEQADGLFEIEKDLDFVGDGSDPFPGTGNKTTFNFTSTPNASSYASSANTLVQILNIANSGSNIIATMKVGIAPGFNSQFTTNAAGWTPLNGTWNITPSGFYHSPGLSNMFVSTMRNTSYPKLTYTVKMRRTGCNNCSNLIFFRGNPTPLTSDGSWNNGYVFIYTNSGSFLIGKQTGGSFTTFVNWTPSAAITGSSNTLKVTANGTFLQFYINNVRVAFGNFSGFSTGKVGISFYRDASANNHLYIDSATLSTTAPASAPGSDVNGEGILIYELNGSVTDSMSYPQMAP